ncbi:MAG: site-2 protease family protein [Candidatus Omnitrophica bacterium]|nr:site-2 protease family protein [Candidatus Omnitrophota bacterium]
MGAITAIIIFSILIVVHEFGHFLAAKQAGVKVEKFSIGFGPTILKIKGKETIFQICIFPLGGYVKMAGEDRQSCSGQSNEFFSKPVGLRARIVMAGPLSNYLMAFFIFWAIAFIIGVPSSKPVVGQVLAEYPAVEAGITAGDIIVAVNGQSVKNWQDMASIIHKSRDKINLTILRDKKLMSLDSELNMKEDMDEFGKKIEVANIGIAPVMNKYDFIGSFLKAGYTIKTHTVRFFRGIYAILTGIVPFEKAVIGPLGIGFLSSKVAQADFFVQLNFLALLSISLGLINLFPIPVLDGGHLMFFLVEKVRKKEVSKRTEEILTKVGLALLAVIFLFAFYNDVKRGPHFFDEDNKKNVEEEAK